MIPDWAGIYTGHTNEVLHYIATNRTYREHPMEEVGPWRSLAFVFNGRVYEMPPVLKDVPWMGFVIIHNNSPLTKAVNGAFVGLNGVTARIECYCNKYGVTLQAIRVEGPLLEDVNNFYDYLLVGKLNHLCANPVALAEQMAGAQLLRVLEQARRQIHHLRNSGEVMSPTKLREGIDRLYEILYPEVNYSLESEVSLSKLRLLVGDLMHAQKMGGEIGESAARGVANHLAKEVGVEVE
jgi:hypothetical protein